MILTLYFHHLLILKIVLYFRIFNDFIFINNLDPFINNNCVQELVFYCYFALNLYNFVLQSSIHF